MIAQIPRVMTLEETADYLRLPLATIEQQAVYGQIPGRRIENRWRFLREALDDWLRVQDSRAILIQQAGALADVNGVNDMNGDGMVDALLAEIYAERGRPETESDDAPA